MKKHIPWLIVLAVLVGAGALFYHSRLGEPQAPPPPPPPVPNAPATAPAAPAAGPGKESPTPLVRYPLSKADKGSATDNAGHGASEGKPLPALDDSDETLEQALFDLFGRKAVESLFRLKSIARHVAVTVDDLPRAKLPQRYMLTKAVAGRFAVTGEAGDYAISPDNYRRYTPYVRLVEDVNIDDLVSVYVRFYPLLQTAYKDLGYPSGYFNDRVMEAIDNLLAAPDVKGPVKLVQPNVLYEFANPRLEALSAGQKMLIRMGPRNEARVKARLRELRKALLARVADTGTGHRNP